MQTLVGSESPDMKQIEKLNAHFEGGESDEEGQQADEEVKQDKLHL